MYYGTKVLCNSTVFANHAFTSGAVQQIFTQVIYNDHHTAVRGKNVEVTVTAQLLFGNSAAFSHCTD